MENVNKVTKGQKPDFDYGLAKAFIKRATHHYYLHSDLGFNLEDSNDISDFTLGLMTEWSDSFDKDDDSRATEVAMAKLAIVSGLLTGEPKQALQNDLTELVDTKEVPRQKGKLREFALSIGGEAGTSLKERFPSDVDTPIKIAQTSGHISTKRRVEHSPAREPDYTDLEDVVKYLYEAGLVSPSHAAALLVTLGYFKPETGVPDKLKNDIRRIQNDLRARIAVYHTPRVNGFKEKGVRILESFITQSIENPNIKLIVDDSSSMIAVSDVLLDLHRLGDVRGTNAPERPNKYDGMGTIIPIDES